MSNPARRLFSISLMLLMAGGVLVACATQTPKPIAASVDADQDQAAAMASGDFSSCAVCHGSGLKGNEATAAPALTGLPPWYVKNQLKAFKAGWRGGNPADVKGVMMHRTAQLLTDTMIDQAVAYVANLREKPITTAKSVSAPLYADNCATCHGENGSGNEKRGAPPIAGISEWYAINQLEKFRKGWRGAHPNDATGQDMAAAITELSDEDLLAITKLLAGEYPHLR